MSPSALEESNIQFREAWKLYARASPAGEVIEAPGLTVADANLSWVFLNLGFLTDPGDRDLEHHAREAINHFASDGRPWGLFACQDFLSEESRATLTRLGLSHSLDLVGMAADRLRPPVRPLPAAETRWTDGEETRMALADLNAAAYGVPREWAREALLEDSLWRNPIHGAVAYVGGEPVSAAFAVPIADVLYVGWVASAVAHRGRGYAELVIRRSLEEASRATGLQRTVLHATDDGYPVYVRMGYRAVTTFPMFVTS